MGVRVRIYWDLNGWDLWKRIDGNGRGDADVNACGCGRAWDMYKDDGGVWEDL